MKRMKIMTVLLLTSALCFTACGQQNTNAEKDIPTEEGENIAGVVATGTASASVTVTSLDVSDMFTDRDKEIGYDEESCARIVLQGSSAQSTDSGVKINGTTVTITGEGTYLISGNLQNGSIIVDAEKTDKIQLVLDNVNISCDSCAAVYIKQADKVFITLAPDSENVLTNTGEFVAIDDNNIDGAIFSKDDLTLNGLGSLTVSSEYGHGVVSKDDLVITGGSYRVTAAGHGISGKDSVRIAEGSIQVTAGKDGIHSGNDEEEELGFVYIAGGDIVLSVDDDGIHGEAQVLISDGNIQIMKSYEGIEGKSIEIAGGTIALTASDDGLNATNGSAEGFGFGKPGKNMTNSSNAVDTANTGLDVYILISGGKLSIKANGDGIDSNGALYVTGGETYVSGPENSGNGALDYGGEAKIKGGVLIAVGASGMAMNFGSDSTQGSMLVNISDYQQSGSMIELKDSQGNVLISYEAQSRYNSVLVSCPEIQLDSTYTLIAGEVSNEITMTELIYGSSNGGGMGGFGGGSMRGGEKSKLPEGEMPNRERTKLSEGEIPNEGKPELPEGEMPDGQMENPPEFR